DLELLADELFLGEQRVALCAECGVARGIANGRLVVGGERLEPRGHAHMEPGHDRDADDPAADRHEPRLVELRPGRPARRRGALLRAAAALRSLARTLARAR